MRSPETASQQSTPANLVTAQRIASGSPVTEHRDFPEYGSLRTSLPSAASHQVISSPVTVSSPHPSSTKTGALPAAFRTGGQSGFRVSAAPARLLSPAHP